MDWDRLVVIVNNMSSKITFDNFPLNNVKFPLILQYIKSL